MGVYMRDGGNEEGKELNGCLRSVETDECMKCVTVMQYSGAFQDSF